MQQINAFHGFAKGDWDFPSLPAWKLFIAIMSGALGNFYPIFNNPINQTKENAE